jgi:hypothetical protein
VHHCLTVKRPHSPSTRIVLLTVGLAMAVTAMHSQAENRVARRGGPRDWSANRVIATRFGPDLDANVDRDWRTYMKHAQLERARANRVDRLDWLGVLTRGVMKKPAPVNGSKLDWNLATGGYGSVIGSPAKYSADISVAKCSDVIYFTVDQPGSATAVNLIAITNPYGFCPGNAGGTTPTVKFGLAMQYGTATSAVPSLDGTVLYVLESRPSAQGGVILHAINVNNITVNKGSYNFGTGVWSGARALAAPTGLSTSEQLFQITYTGVTNNNASPYLDYSTNQMFFGDSAGRIHRIIDVNKTTATRDTTHFPVQCGTQQLQSPVFVNNQVITTSADGRIYRINMAGTVPAGLYSTITSAQGGAGTAGGVGGGLSAPIIDISNTNIIVAGNNANGFPVRGVGFYDFNFGAGASQVDGVSVGAGSTTIAPQAPSFDDAFWTTNNGNMYVPGAPSSGVGTYLIRVPYNGTGVSNPAGFATLKSSGAAQSVATSPVTEFLTASSLSNPDFIFVGGATGNYRYMNRISSGFGGSEFSPVAMANFFQPVGGGGVSSGIVIDTRTTAITGSTATANIYFGTIGVQSSLTQSRIVQLAQQF